MTTMSCIRRLFAVASVTASLLFVPTLRATPLLSAAYEAQLEAWLGQGNLDFTNVFTKQAGSSGASLHAAIDGKGPTFLLMDISGHGGSYYNGNADLPHQIVGGFNPVSWNGNAGWTLNPNDAGRDAFIYNLSSTTVQRQNLTGQGDVGSGQYQTKATFSYGRGDWDFAFGGGVDLGVRFDLTRGQAANYSYGGTSNGNEIVTGGPNFENRYSYFDVGAIEVYTFALGTNTVPDTAGMLGLLSVSLLALAAFRRRVA